MSDNHRPFPDPREEHKRGEALWLERYGTYVTQAYAWRLTALLALASTIISTGGVVWISGKSQFVPYVVQVDKLGDALAVTRADEARPIEPIVVRAQLARWLAAVRTVYADATAQRKLVDEAYAMINQRSQAFDMLNDHMRAHDPFQRARSETASVEIQSILPLTRETWRMEWREETLGRDGKSRQSQTYQATVSVTISPPLDEAAIRSNPMGVYIDAYSWSQRLEGRV